MGLDGIILYHKSKQSLNDSVTNQINPSGRSDNECTDISNHFKPAGNESNISATSPDGAVIKFFFKFKEVIIVMNENTVIGDSNLSAHHPNHSCYSDSYSWWAS
jgi:hypothetical protein